MESYMLFGFVGILREVTKLLCKNGQVMACLTLLILSSSSIFFVSNFFSIKPLISDMIESSLFIATDPTSPQLPNLFRMKEDITAVIGVEWIYALITTLASLFLSIATIIVSAVLHEGNNLSLKQLFLSTITSLKRPFYTWFYITLFKFGYYFFLFANLQPMLLIVENAVASKALIVILVILASVLDAYLAVVWNSAFVVSVLEEKSGIEALGKAAQLVKGMLLHGFLLNLLYGFLLNLLYLITGPVLLRGMRLMFVKQSSVFHITIGLLVVNSICLFWMFSLMAFTVFYYQCKKAHGEEVELQVSFEYNKIPTTLLNENLP